MEHYDVKRLALVLAVQADIEGMKAKNADHKLYATAMAHNYRGEIMISDERYRQLMIDVGMPNSTSLLRALKQVAMESALNERER